MARVKIWKMTPESSAQFAVTAERVYMVGDRKHFISTSPQGNVIYGPLSIVAGSESMRTGGIFAELPDFTQAIPSTVVTPLPSKIPVPPVHVAFNLAADVSYFMSLLV